VVVDGAPDWDALESMLPPPAVRMQLQPPSGEGQDSAAIASEMSTGCPGAARRAVSAAGVPLGAAAAEAGLATAAATDSCATDPTVSTFFVSANDRYNVSSVAEELRASPLGMMLGGTSRMLAGNCSAGCCASTEAELLAAVRGGCPAGSRIVGSFSDGDSALARECNPMAYATARAPSMPSLAGMATAAMDRLGLGARAGRGAFLMLGCDRVDHAAHANDTAAIAASVSECADAVAAVLRALEWRIQDANVLVAVTGDHWTVAGERAHPSAPVPLLLYGGGAGGAAGSTQPSSAFASLFPFHRNGSCYEGALADRVRRPSPAAAAGLSVAVALLGVAALALSAARRSKAE